MAKTAWQTRAQLFGVLVVFWVYLIVGACIFTTLERGNAENLHQNFLVGLVDFLSNNTCVDHADLRDYSSIVVNAYAGGLRWTPESGFNTTKYGYEHWDLIDSLFFCATIVTTIGYGRLAPSTKLGQSVCIIYALIGIPLSGWLVTIIGQQLQKRLTYLWDRRIQHLPCILYATTPRGKRLGSGTAVVCAGLVIYVVLIVLPACLFNYLEGWDWLTSQYYTFISFTTIGFGDYVAGDSLKLGTGPRIVYKVLLIFYLLLGMGFMTLLLQSLQRIQQQNAASVRKLAKKRVIRRILKKRLRSDMTDGRGSKGGTSIEGEDFVVITTGNSIDDSNNEQFEMDEMGRIEYVTVTCVDDAVQTPHHSHRDAGCQTDPVILVFNGNRHQDGSKQERHGGKTTAQNNIVQTDSDWKITENKTATIQSLTESE